MPLVPSRSQSLAGNRSSAAFPSRVLASSISLLLNVFSRCSPSALGDFAFWDAWAGARVRPSVNGSRAEFALPVERSGFGGLLRVNRSDGAAMAAVGSLMAAVAQRTRVPLQSIGNEWKPLQQRMQPTNRTAPMPAATAASLGMVTVAPPPTGKFNFTVGALGVNRGEAGPTQLPDGVDVQYPFEPHPTEDHSTVLTLDAAYYIDRFKVTNQNYSDFLKVSGWRPAVQRNWLKAWTHGGGTPTLPAGEEKLPVTWVSRGDAEAYCKHTGRRLPREFEWQYAGQGSDGRRFP